jgi:succinyl-diaminopimelate desuccinylase
MKAEPRSPELADLRREPTLSPEFLTRVLQSLVQTQSVNPGIYESAMAARVTEWLKPTGAEVTLVESLPERHSVAAVLKGSGDGPTLVLNGHMDTVPIDDASLWDDDPFSGVVKDGYLWGRGACDMKAGLAVQIAVAHYLAGRPEDLRGTLVLHFAVGEECAEPGTLSLINAGFVGDLGIVTEPTELKVATAERGLVFFHLRIKGRSIHASKAQLGLNPNWKLRAVLDAVEEYEREIKKRSHPLLPPGSCTPTVIRSGVKDNAVPDFCDVSFDRRLIPGETIDGELAELRARLERIRDGDPDFEFELTRARYAFSPAEISPESAFARRVAEAAQEVTGAEAPGEIIGTTYASDVRNLVNDAGMEAITFGPGNVAECHCANERVALDQLSNAALVVARVASDVLA